MSNMSAEQTPQDPGFLATKHNTANWAFAKHRQRIAARDERIAHLKSSLKFVPQKVPDSPFPNLMILPPEIRHRIYQYTLAQSRRLHLEILRTPALACTSKQIREECLPVFLQVNRFQAYFSKGYPQSTFEVVFAEETLKWLKSLSQSAKLIRDIRVTFQGDMIQRGPRSSVFQIVANKSQISVSHVDFRCNFCIDGYRDEGCNRPYPVFDHPAVVLHVLNDIDRFHASRAQGVHDFILDKVGDLYFKRSDKEWGKSGLSIRETIDLARAAEMISKKPEYMRMVHDITQDEADLAERLVTYIDMYIQDKASERLHATSSDTQESSLQGNDTPDNDQEISNLENAAPVPVENLEAAEGVVAATNELH